MKVNVLTLYPEMFPGFLGFSLAGKALAENKWELSVKNIRDYATDAYKSVDDAPFGGGAGMVMRAAVVDKALQSLPQTGPVFYLSPRGQPFTQQTAHEWALLPEMTFLCGRFEGVDQRVLDKWNMREISLGDFVLSGGEPALLAMLDATVRLLPEVLGNHASLAEESFANGLLEYPHYTHPQVWEERAAPDVLLSGHHANIQRWRKQQAEELTRKNRPDMWRKYINNNTLKG